MKTPKSVLEEVWGHREFRKPQEDIIGSVLSGRDTLALLPTGGGKSICFQIPGLLLPGITVVISPLIALMKDQTEGLNRRGIGATALHSGLSNPAAARKWEGLQDGLYKFLYVAPERLQNEAFLQKLTQLPISLLAVDEAHCISQWGYDFRPSYLKIAAFRRLLSKVPVIALTASATPQVQADIVQWLELKSPAVFSKSFRRENLAYSAIRTENPAGEVVRMVMEEKGSGIVYARTRKRTEQLAEALKKAGVAAGSYHGGMGAEARAQAQEAWISGKMRVMCATNAFGMGIDKPDVRWVIHFQLPSDPESYYQEAGRAGRDGNPARAVALWNDKELWELSRWVSEKYPTWEDLKVHYQALCNFYGIAEGAHPFEPLRFEAAEIAAQMGLPLIPFFNSIQLLDREDWLKIQELPEDLGYIQILANPQEVIRYKESQPSQAPLVDFLLRNLGGEAYWEEQGFSPYQWAKKLGTDTGKLGDQLQFLAQRNLISYRPPTTEPTLRFLKPRVRFTQRDLNWEKYTFLKAQAEHRLASFVEWVKAGGNACRSLILEQYFGETGGKPCGICDLCRQRSDGSGAYLESQLSDAFDQLLQEGPVPYATLLQKTQIGSPAKRQEHLRFLIDRGILTLDSQGRISRKKS